jgi:hypothetical protein
MFVPGPLMRWVVEKFSIKVSFEQGKRDWLGNLILQRPGMIQTAPFILTLITLIYLCLKLLDHRILTEERLGLMILMGFFTLLWGVLWVAVVISRTVVDEEGITTYRLLGKKHLRFDDITAIDYSSLWGGCTVLKGQKVRLTVPFDTNGFLEFYQMLKDKFGYEKCKGIGIQLGLRKERVGM